MDDGGQGMRRLAAFTRDAVHMAGGTTRELSPGICELNLPDRSPERLTSSRERASADDGLSLLGL